jgi:hypothetical protein
MADTNETVITNMVLGSTPVEIDILITSVPLSQEVQQQDILITSVPLSQAGQQADLANTVLVLSETTDETNSTNTISTIMLDQTITAWNPIAIVTTPIDLLSSGSGDQILEALVQDYVCTNSRSRALGTIPPSHPGA